MSVAVYVPPTALAGTATLSAGSHDAVLSPMIPVAETTVWESLDSVMEVGVAVTVPVVVMVPGAYETSVAGMVSGPVPPPVVKSVDAAVAVQLASSAARSSTTVTGPMGVGPIVVPGLPEPSVALSGTDMLSAPVSTENVTVVDGSNAPGADAAARSPP